MARRILMSPKSIGSRHLALSKRVHAKAWGCKSERILTIGDKKSYLHKPTINRSIANAKVIVTISCDGWKANNDVLDLLAVVVHYLGDYYKLHNVVLALSNTLGSHTGANIADQLFDVLKDYQISGNQIAYFAADNATNNDKALKVLSDRVTLDLVKSRHRCVGHIFNLVCTAILFGVDSEALEDAEYDFSEPGNNSQEVTEFNTTLANGSEQ
jgi:hypothetical protein